MPELRRRVAGDDPRAPTRGESMFRFLSSMAEAAPMPSRRPFHEWRFVRVLAQRLPLIEMRRHKEA
jgi:hypothetical protein